MKNAINDIFYCNTDVRIANDFIMITDKHLQALEAVNICYHEVRHLTSNTGTVYHNIAVNNKEFDRTLTVIQNVNYLSARKTKQTYREV